MLDSIQNFRSYVSQICYYSLWLIFSEIKSFISKQKLLVLTMLRILGFFNYLGIMLISCLNQSSKEFPVAFLLGNIV